MSWGLYVHVPWCRVRCPYCAFYVVTDKEQPRPPWQAFVDAVHREHALRRPLFEGRPDTVFLGGGTPSRLPPDALVALLAGLDAADATEVSAEANPEDLTDAWLAAAQDAGITRVSLGVQTLRPHLARRLGRAHTLAQAHDALERLGRSGLSSWSADLIFAVPDQTLDDLEADLDALLAAGAPHVSLYGLTFEPDTPFDRARRRGRMAAPPDDLWREMYDLLVRRLGAAGLRRYEVSNFARPGHESRHNRGYWGDRPYMGLGPSAHGYAPDGSRWVNVASLERWLADDDPTAERERPTGEQRAVDLLVSGLRGVDGVALARLEARTGHRLRPAAVGALEGAGLVRVAEGRVRLTDAGFPLCDAVTGRLVDALEPGPDLQ